MSRIASKDKPIGNILKAVLLSVLSFFETALLKRVNEDIGKGLELVIIRLRETVNALNDANPENREQILEIIRKFFNEDLSDYAREIIAEEIAKLQDENLRKVLAFALDKAVDVLEIYTDENKDNAAQIAEFWDVLRKSEETHTIILDNLLQPGMDEVGIGEELQELILDIVETVLKGQAEQAQKLTAKIQIVA